MNMIATTVSEREKTAVKKPYRFRSQVPSASDAAVPTIFAPHMNPFARACWLMGTMSMTSASVAIS